jgi:small subunit ribosomal protein S2
MTRLPGAIIVVDIKKEHIAVAEAFKLNIPIFAMVDTNSDPRPIDYVIPSNDDAAKSIDKIITYLTGSIAEGLAERKESKEKKATKKDEKAPEAKSEEKAAE